MAAKKRRYGEGCREGKWVAMVLGKVVKGMFAEGREGVEC